MWITFLILCTTMRLYTEKEQLSTFFLRVCAQLPSFGRGQGKKPAPPAASGGRGETCGAGQKNGHTGRAKRRGKADTQAGQDEAEGKGRHTGRAGRSKKTDTQTERRGQKSTPTGRAGRREKADTQAERGGGERQTHRKDEAKQKKRTFKQSEARQKNKHTGRAERKKRRRRGEAQKGLKNDLCKNRKIGYQSALFRE